MMKMYFYAKKTPRKNDGKYPIMGRIVLDDNRAQFFTGIHLTKGELPFINDSHNAVICREIKMLIETSQYVSREMTYKQLYENECLSIEETISIAKEYLTSIRSSFLQSLDVIIDDMKNKGASRKTTEKYALLHDRVHSFVQNTNPHNDLMIYDIDDCFFVEFRCYLLKNFNYSESSLDKIMQLLRTVRKVVMKYKY